MSFSTSTCSGDPNEQMNGFYFKFIYIIQKYLYLLFLVSPPSKICKNWSQWIIPEFHIMSPKFQVKNKDHLESPPSSPIFQGFLKHPNLHSWIPSTEHHWCEGMGKFLHVRTVFQFHGASTVFFAMVQEPQGLNRPTKKFPKKTTTTKTRQWFPSFKGSWDINTNPN